MPRPIELPNGSEKNSLNFLWPNEISEAVDWAAEAVAEVGGRLWLVGGAVRDAMLGLPVSDADLEVYGVEVGELEALLTKQFKVNAVGRSFGVFKLSGTGLDVALPRQESKVGQGHQGFRVEGNPWLHPKISARRRDFTINAMLYEPREGVLYDPWGGATDLQAGVLRHVSEAFAEDPLRVLRGMQFVARFSLEPAEETIRLCRGMTLEGLSSERIFEEWRKFLLRGQAMSSGLAYLKATKWLRFFPELAALDGCEQDPQWHPEGDVLVHTGHCLDAFAKERVGDDWEDLVVGLAVLLHDVGKPDTTFREEDGRIRSPGHDVEGKPIARAFLERMTSQRSLVEEVLPLVEYHMRPAQLQASRASAAAVRRLARNAGRLDRLARVVSADSQGSPPLDRGREPVTWLLEKAEALAIAAASPKPLLKGRDFMALGYPPGRRMGKLIGVAFEAQLDGAFATVEEGRQWVQENMDPPAS